MQEFLACFDCGGLFWNVHEDSQALINGVELLRMLRAHDETVSNAVSFVFPNTTETYVAKVTVDFDSNDLVFKYSFETLEKGNVKQAVQAAIQQKKLPFSI